MSMSTQKYLLNISECSSALTSLEWNEIEATDDVLHCYIQQETSYWWCEQDNGDRHAQACSNETKNPTWSKDCSVERFYAQQQEERKISNMQLITILKEIICWSHVAWFM